jgi:F-type H+-transporting ATPase subunit epsilon
VAQPFECSIVTPDKAVFEDKVTYVNLPAHDGQYGVLANHAPVLTQLGAGELQLQLPSGENKTFNISGGFAQVNNNQLTLLTEKAS